MGHYEEILEGKGETKSEARSAALEQFWYDNGHDYSISKEISETWIAIEIPQRWEKRLVKDGGVNWRTNRRNPDVEIMEQQPAWGTPTRQWLQVWEFVIDFHR